MPATYINYTRIYNLAQGPTITIPSMNILCNVNIGKQKCANIINIL